MSQRPPPLPGKVLAQVLRMATSQGRLVLILASGFAMLSAIEHDWYATMVGILIAGGGTVELHGAGLLRHGHARGHHWLVRSQVLVLSIILIYAAIQIFLLQKQGLKAIYTQDYIDELKALGNTSAIDERSMVRMWQEFYLAFTALSLVYQGGMGLFFHRRRASILQALDQAATQAENQDRLLAQAFAGRVTAGQTDGGVPMSPQSKAAKVLARVMRMANMEGWSVVIIGGGGAVVSALGQSWFGAVVGSLIAGCGALELHGVGLLRVGQARGQQALVRSQLLLLGVILIYVLISLHGLTPQAMEQLMAHMSPEERAALSQGTGGDLTALGIKMARLMYIILGGATLLYQGGMALYYHRCRAAIGEALGTNPQ